MSTQSQLFAVIVSAHHRDFFFSGDDVLPGVLTLAESVAPVPKEQQPNKTDGSALASTL